MSFEAVPCMFKGRAEDGHEASMFGLLIRPSGTTPAGAAPTSASLAAIESGKMLVAGGGTTSAAAAVASTSSGFCAIATQQQQQQQKSQLKHSSGNGSRSGVASKVLPIAVAVTATTSTSSSSTTTLLNTSASSSAASTSYSVAAGAPVNTLTSAAAIQIVPSSTGNQSANHNGHNYITAMTSGGGGATTTTSSSRRGGKSSGREFDSSTSSTSCGISSVIPITPKITLPPKVTHHTPSSAAATTMMPIYYAPGTTSTTSAAVAAAPSTFIAAADMDCLTQNSASLMMPQIMQLQPTSWPSSSASTSAAQQQQQQQQEASSSSTTTVVQYSQNTSSTLTIHHQQHFEMNTTTSTTNQMVNIGGQHHQHQLHHHQPPSILPRIGGVKQQQQQFNFNNSAYRQQHSLNQIKQQAIAGESLRSKSNNSNNTNGNQLQQRRNHHKNLAKSSTTFDSPSPSQVVPQINADSVAEPLLVSTTSSSTTLAFLQPSSGLVLDTGSKMLSPTSHSAYSTGVDGSGATTATDVSAPSIDDLNAIDYSQLLSNTAIVCNAEEFLSQEHNDLFVSGGVDSGKKSKSKKMKQNANNNGNAPKQIKIQQRKRGERKSTKTTTATTLLEEISLNQQQQQQQSLLQVRPVVADSNQELQSTSSASTRNGGQQQQFRSSSFGNQQQQNVIASWQQQQQQNAYGPCTSGSYPQNMFYPQQQQQQQQQQNSNHHPQISSSTPDSGVDIQSIDGSPPSIASYTPPMISPYTHQVKSCESATSNNCQQQLLQHHQNQQQHQQYPLLMIPSNIPPLTASTSSMGEEEATINSNNTTHSEVMSTDSAKVEGNNDDDYSDMPVLIPANSVEYYDDSSDHQLNTSNRSSSSTTTTASRSSSIQVENKSQRNDNNDYADVDNNITGRRMWSAAEKSRKDGAADAEDANDAARNEKTVASPLTEKQKKEEEQLLFSVTSSMNLTELAERLSSNIDLEQLRQLTSLIQSKAAAKLQQSPSTSRNCVSEFRAAEEAEERRTVNGSKSEAPTLTREIVAETDGVKCGEAWSETLTKQRKKRKRKHQSGEANVDNDDGSVMASGSLINAATDSRLYDQRRRNNSTQQRHHLSVSPVVADAGTHDDDVGISALTSAYDYEDGVSTLDFVVGDIDVDDDVDGTVAGRIGADFEEMLLRFAPSASATPSDSVNGRSGSVDNNSCTEGKAASPSPRKIHGGKTLPIMSAVSSADDGAETEAAHEEENDDEDADEWRRSLALYRQRVRERLNRDLDEKTAELGGRLATMTVSKDRRGSNALSAFRLRFVRWWWLYQHHLDESGADENADPAAQWLSALIRPSYEVKCMPLVSDHSSNGKKERKKSTIASIEAVNGKHKRKRRKAEENASELNAESNSLKRSKKEESAKVQRPDVADTSKERKSRKAFAQRADVEFVPPASKRQRKADESDKSEVGNSKEKKKRRGSSNRNRSAVDSAKAASISVVDKKVIVSSSGDYKQIHSNVLLEYPPAVVPCALSVLIHASAGSIGDQTSPTKAIHPHQRRSAVNASASTSSFAAEGGPTVCKCTSKLACFSDAVCTNRARRVECVAAKNCELAHCANRQFSALINQNAEARLQLLQTSRCGRGVGAFEPLAKGHLIGEFVGEMLRTATYVKRYASKLDAITDFYGVALPKGYALDATKKGNCMRFINHSCRPNCELQTWLVNGHYRVGVFALRNIFSGEELCLDYAQARHLTVGGRPQRCQCGAPKCGGVVPSLNAMELLTVLAGSVKEEAMENAATVKLAEEQKPTKKRKLKRANAETKPEIDSAKNEKRPAKEVLVGSAKRRNRHSFSVIKTSNGIFSPKLFLRRNVRVVRRCHRRQQKLQKEKKAAETGQTKLPTKRSAPKQQPASTSLSALLRPSAFNNLLSKDLRASGECEKVAQILHKIFADFVGAGTKRDAAALCRATVSPRRARQLRHRLRVAFDGVALEDASAALSALIDRFDATMHRHLDALATAGGGKFEAARAQYATSKKAFSASLLKACNGQVLKEVVQLFAEDRSASAVLMPSARSRALSGGSVASSTGGLPAKRGGGGGITSDSGASSLRILSAEADLSYMDSDRPVGSYDPDRCTRLTLSDNVDDDCVRCICGIMEDDGVMTQCDRCHFWLHADCLDFDINSKKEFICDFCQLGLAVTPNVDIVLRPQPDIKLRGCVYYRTLVNSRGIQVRVNESVYVERLINDEHKRILRKLHEECVAKPSPTIELSNGTSRVESKAVDLKRTSKNFSAKLTALDSEDSDETSGRRKKSKKREMNGGDDEISGRKRKADQKAKNEVSTANRKSELEPSSILNYWWPAAPDPADFDNAANSDVELSGAAMRAANATGEFCFRRRAEAHRKDLRTFRVERLFTGPNGERFVFGVYYARPHETFCDSSRMFYRNELFWTPLFDTLPLNAIVGRCLILEPQIWASGRPKSPKYAEEDVFICEYQIDKNQRCFEKILPRNRYTINTESYVFDRFPKRLTPKRDFTPFILPTQLSTTAQSTSTLTATRSTNNAEKQQKSVSADQLLSISTGPYNSGGGVAASPSSLASPAMTRGASLSPNFDAAAAREREERMNAIYVRISADRVDRICRRIARRRQEKSAPSEKPSK